MKFYRVTNYIYWSKFINSKLNAIYCDANIRFLKNGKHHNTKNAAFINYKGDKQFILNGKFYGNQINFTKESWRRFVKLNVFL
jgi:hypothetical protein